MEQIEEKAVSKVYSAIAGHFSSKRINQWPWITSFIDEININNSKSKTLDIGCGNGRNMEIFAEHSEIIGVDNCREFVQICHNKGHNVVYADMTNIPYPDNYFDYLLSIASFHHLSTRERRITALKEFHRVSQKNCVMLLSVWSFNQPTDSKQSKKITKYGDNFVSWNKNGVEYERFYYIFKRDEIEELFQETGWKIQEYSWNYGNEVYKLVKID
tara:strand:+ start:97 stop:741 length:645 start_codon:yes stop_codon:yes gene_type:complete